MHILETQAHFHFNANILHEYVFPTFFWMSALGIALEIPIPQQHLYPSLHICNFDHYIIHSVMLETLKVSQPCLSVSHLPPTDCTTGMFVILLFIIIVFIRSWLLTEQLL